MIDFWYCPAATVTTMPMMAITTSSSIRVKPGAALRLVIGVTLPAYTRCSGSRRGERALFDRRRRC